MNKFFVFLFLFLGAGQALAAEIPVYEMIKEKSSLKFIAIQNNAPVEGKFNQFSADIKFDPDNLENSKIKVEVETGSVDASYGEVVSNLKLPEWLSVAAFPKAIFISKKINRFPMTDNFYAEGVLSLRGKTMPATVNFQLDLSDKIRVIAIGYATVHRSDFGVGQGEWAKDDVIKDEVRVEFRIVADKK